MKQLALQKLKKESANCANLSDITQLGKVVKDEIPHVRDALTSSHVALLQGKKSGQSSSHELKTLSNTHNMLKKKVGILEEELEKAL